MEKLTLIQCKLKAPKNQYNSFGKYKYRNCEDILEALKPLLAEHNCCLTITDEVLNINNRFYIKATAIISDREENKTVSVSALAREAESQKGMNEAQITGSTSSYARKYALNGLFCIDDTKDADSTNTHGKNGSDAVKTTVNMPDATQTPQNVLPPQSSNTAQPGAISEDSAKNLVSLAKMNGYTQKETQEIIFALGYTKFVDILQQDYDTIVEELTIKAEDWRKKNKEAWDE